MTEVQSSYAPLSIRLLGPMQVSVQGQELDRQHSRKALWLLAWLCLHYECPVERAFIASLLWPDSSPKQAFANLRNMLNDLRRALGHQAYRLLSPTHQTILLDLSGVEVDVIAFDAALARGDVASLEQAVTLYSGPLLEGCQEEWMFVERQQREQAYIKTLEQLAEQAQQSDKPDLATEYLRRAIQLDPLRESLQRALMQALATQGDYNAALLAYRELRLLLHQEMHTEPDAVTQALFQQIRQQARQPKSLQRSEPPSLIQSPPPCLPAQFTRFFGREEEIARLMALLLPNSENRSATVRLLTLTGTGGTGKTRLVIEAASPLAERFPGHILFVPLADLSDPRLIPTAILNSLHLPPSPEVDALEQIVAFLSQAPALLILDNMEHLLCKERRKSEDGASVVRLLLERIPTLVCLVTSRQRLNLEGEREYPLLPLEIPDPQHTTPEQVARCESVQLFLDRAQAIQPDFQVTNKNAAAVAQLCARLEGIPLAIELAAARAQVMTPSQMLTQLEHRFEFLVSRRRDAIDRHRTLHAAIDWSYRLLSPELQRFFTCLSVFRGGWSVEAAEQVCMEPQALVYLEQLRECSLILTQESGEEMRYRMIETLREYAWEQMSEAGRTEIQQQHLEFFLQLAEEAAPKLTGSEQAQWLQRLQEEHDNLRTGIHWCQTDKDSQEAGLRLAGCLWRFWDIRGYLSEGREFLHVALSQEAANPHTPTRAKALNAAGSLAYNQGDYAAAQNLFEASLTIRRELGDKQGIANSLNNLGTVANEQGDYATARDLYMQSLAIKRELGDKWGVTSTLSNLGLMAYNQDDYVGARTLYEESLALYRELGDKRGIATSLRGLGNAAWSQGDYAEARTLYEQSRAIFKELGDKQGIAISLSNLGLMAYSQDDYAEARTLYEQSLQRYRELGDKWGIASSLSYLGTVANEQGDYAEARALQEQSLAIRRQIGDKQGIANSLEALAQLAEGQEGQTQRAIRLWAAANVLRETIGSAMPPNDKAAYDLSVAAEQMSIGAEAFAAAWEEGKAMTIEQAIAYALEGPG